MAAVGTDKMNLVIGEEGQAMPAVSGPPAYEQSPGNIQMAQQYGFQSAQHSVPQPVVSQPSVQHTVVQVMGTGVEAPKPPFPQGINAWSTGLCDCFSDMAICMLGFFCTPCLACKVAGHMNENCCTACCGGVAGMRTKLRTMLGIRGSINSDCCAASCCTACVLCQLEREMNNWGI